MTQNPLKQLFDEHNLAFLEAEKARRSHSLDAHDSASLTDTLVKECEAHSQGGDTNSSDIHFCKRRNSRQDINTLLSLINSSVLLILVDVIDQDGKKQFMFICEYMEFSIICISDVYSNIATLHRVINKIKTTGLLNKTKCNPLIWRVGPDVTAKDIYYQTWQREHYKLDVQALMVAAGLGHTTDRHTGINHINNTGYLV